MIHGGKESIFDLIMMNGALIDIRIREKKGAVPLPEKDKRIAKDFIASTTRTLSLSGLSFLC